MELTSIAPEDRRVPLLHPATEKEVGLTFILRSPYDEEVKKAERKWQNARFQKRKQRMTAESMETLKLNVIMAAVKGWTFDRDDLEIFGERTPAFNPALLKRILTADKTAWIRDFLDKELGDEGSFFSERES